MVVPQESIDHRVSLPLFADLEERSSSDTFTKSGSVSNMSTRIPDLDGPQIREHP